jgi:signal recognition particle GTPase
MDKFTKSILNYFATYTETRFRFQTKISYKWTDDLLTAEMSVFPEFQKKVLNSIKNKGLLDISIKQGEYAVSLDGDEFKKFLVQKLDTNYSFDFLKNCIEQAKLTLTKTESDKVVLVGDSKDKKNGTELIDNKEFEEKVLREGFRKFNLSFRNAVQETLLVLQKSKRQELLQELHLTTAPLTSFNPNTIEQEIYNNLQENAHKAKDAKTFHEKIKEIIENSSFNLIMYDLYATIRKFATFIGMGKPYIFFHEIFSTVENKNDAICKYPIFLIELKIEEKEDEIALSSDRNVLLINTPAINSFEFNNILTIPRAARLNEASEYLGGVEKFLQNNYNFFNPFLLEYVFKPLTSENKPIINYRVGLQVVQKEDRRLFDYSELITRIDAGKGGKLIDFVKDYVSGNVKNTTDDVDSAYAQKYPKKSVNNLLSTIPLSLNRSQRRILTALENVNNKIVVVDGPPGTGKSYTIAAITYWANQQNKSVVITSHKKAALDVIDGMLIDKFRLLHPKSKPSVLRISENETGINTSQNTLSSPVITAANNRVNDFNESAVKKDIDNWRNAVDAQLKDYWGNSGKYKEVIEKVFKLEKLEQELREKNIWKEGLVIPKIDKDKKINIGSIKECIKTIYKSPIDSLSSEELVLLHEKRNILPDLLDTCNFLNKSGLSLKDIDQIKQNNLSILENLSELLSIISTYLKNNSLIFADENNIKIKLPIKLSMLFNKKDKKDKLKTALNGLNDLQYEGVLLNVVSFVSKQKKELILKDLEDGVQKNIEIEYKRQKIDLLIAVQKTLGFEKQDVKQFFGFLSGMKDILKHVDQETIDSIKNAEEYFSPLLDAVGLKLDNLKESSSLLVKDPAEKVFDYIQLFSDIAINEFHSLPDANLVSSYYESIHKQLENINDRRLKNLNNYAGDAERILVSLKSRKRLKEQELKVLLENISCIISEPDLISQYFPMEEDLIDILIIDEASQVSIAESVSLILRAKQVVIFGDELQYGAVSAVNVNADYASQYFKEIIDNYSEDYKIRLSEKDKDKISQSVSQEVDPEDQEVEPIYYKPEEGTIDWLKTFSIRTSTLNFAKAIKNYSVSLDTHFRSFSEIIDYSNEFFYKPSQIPLVVNRIRTKPIKDVLRFVKVETQGNSGTNVNLDEIEAIKQDILALVNSGFKGSIGIITSFREQRTRMEEILRKELPDYHTLEKKHKLTIWFVGDVQGEERDIIYYSFVEDRKIGNGSLRYIYPVSTKEKNIRMLKMQRLNVSFSRAKDTMVFVHSMPIEEYSDTWLGEALKYYKQLLEKAKDNFIEDESIFDSPAEKELYIQITNTDFYKKNRDKIKIIAQFPMGKYIEETLHRYVPKYRVDFLLTLSERGKERSLILEYDGVEYHTKNPKIVTAHNFSQEYLDYDIARQLELERYGYKFLRVNKFTLLPKEKGQTKIDVLNSLLTKKFDN